MDLRNKIIAIGLHIIMGLVSIYSPIICTIWFYSFFLYSVFKILSKGNEDSFANYAVCYLLGLEIILRMDKVAFVFYESGKYGCAFLMLLALMVEKRKRQLPMFAVFYMVLLLPSIIGGGSYGSSDIFSNISFNLSGPFVLFVSWMYFFKRKIDKQVFERMIYNCILPLISGCFVVVAKLPELNKEAFSTDSNKLLSGGFGPNQVAVVFGFGFAIMFLAWLVKAKITISHTFDIILGMFFLSFAVFTFSRGGVVSGIASVIGGMIVMAGSGRNIKELKQVINLLLVLVLLGTITWVYLNGFTNGFLAQRYEKAINHDQDDPNAQIINTTGRYEIANEDVEIFEKNPIFGVGPGNATAIRTGDLGKNWVAHTEFTRLLAEHGSFGIICIFLLLSSPLIAFRKQSHEGKIIMTVMIILSLSIMLHVAMRLAVVGVIYGLAFADYDFKSLNPLMRTEDA